MRNSKLISFIALLVLALGLVFVSPPDARAADSGVKSAKSSAVKYPPNVQNSFREVKIVFVIQNYSALPPLLRTQNKSLMPQSDLRGVYRVAFSPPILARESFRPDKVVYEYLPSRRKPEIVRMM